MVQRSWLLVITCLRHDDPASARQCERAADRALFGDSFGAAAALVSALAFAGLIRSVRLQSGELRLQRKELELQREELVLQRQELAASNASLTRSSETARFAAYVEFHSAVVTRHHSPEQTQFRQAARHVLDV